MAVSKQYQTQKCATMFIENIRSRDDNITQKWEFRSSEWKNRRSKWGFERRIIIITTLAQSASFLLHLPASPSTENVENEFNDGRVSTKKIFAQAFDVKVGMDFCA